ncbi:MAG: hypothetical protein E7302_04315 [Butyrivibrio sp.]|nr:hypothetical protein [Butyrivibrio sp.]
MVKFDIFIEEDKEWINVTNKKAIIYGAGNTLIKFMDRYHFPNIYMVVDSSELKWGKTVLLNGKEYTIHNPNQIANECTESCFVIMTVNESGFNTIKDVLRKQGCSKLIICPWDKIRYRYSKIHELLLYDPIINCNGVIPAFFCETTEKKLDKVLYELFGNEKKYVYSLLPGANKIVFLLECANERMVLTMPGFRNSTNSSVLYKNKMCDRSKRCSFLQKYDDNGFTKYIDMDGVCIRKYIKNSFENNKKNQVRVLENMKKLHDSEMSINIFESADHYLKRWLDNQIFCYHREELKTMLFEQLSDDFELVSKNSNQISIIHGDIGIGNIVANENEIRFVDWECVEMSDPMIDVCRYISEVLVKKIYKFEDFEIMKNTYAEMKEYLSIYYKCPPTREQTLIGWSVLRVYIIGYLLRILNNMVRTKELVEILDYSKNSYCSNPNN